MTVKVFIDGEAGTTGLQIRQRLAARRDVALMSVDPDRRKDEAARAERLNAADAVILCLPDEAAKAAVAAIETPSVKVIDASTAHRTSPGWTYGFPELRPGQRQAIAASTRVSNPGCYPTGFLALIAPLVGAGLLPPEWPATVNAVSGYTGGGRAMITEFEAPGGGAAYRAYGLQLRHKHVEEMRLHAGLVHPPLFAPAVGRYAQGMIVEAPLQLWALPGRPSAGDVYGVLSAAYAGERFVEVASLPETEALQALEPEALNGSNTMRLYVFHNEAAGQVRLAAVLDNLGKGASGAAVQNLNLMCGLPEDSGL